MKNKLLRKQLSLSNATTVAGKGSGDKLFPKFSFEFLSGDHCLSKCEVKEKSNLISKLHQIGRQSWGDLRRLGRNNGFEPISVAQLRCKIPEEFKKESVSIVFHMTGNIPIIGFRREDVFYVIAIDRTFKAYSH